MFHTDINYVYSFVECNADELEQFKIDKAISLKAMLEEEKLRKFHNRIDDKFFYQSPDNASICVMCGSNFVKRDGDRCKVCDSITELSDFFVKHEKMFLLYDFTGEYKEILHNSVCIDMHYMQMYLIDSKDVSSYKRVIKHGYDYIESINHSCLGNTRWIANLAPQKNKNILPFEDIAENLLSKEEFEKSIDFRLAKKNILITFHPVTLENSSAREQFGEILKALDELEETNLIFTKANSDTDGDVINKMIDEYVRQNPQKAVAFVSLGQLRYLSAIKFVDIVLGNSSSGLTEVPSFKKATINIGDRQKGRIKATSVIDILPVKEEILAAIKKVYSKEFEQILKDTINPYDGGYPSKKMVKVLKETKLDGILKKKFYDIGLK